METQPLEAGIIGALVYADLFDYPLTSQEIHRYLVGHATPPEAVEEHLARNGRLRERLDTIPPFWFLAGRADLVRLRCERESYSRALWPWARRYGHLIAAFPFVRLVAITGSLTMNNVTGPHDDIDFLFVTRAGRVWFVRGLIALVVHLARQHGVHLCPNYVMAEHRLQLDRVDLFTAHELLQMVPLHGPVFYQRLLDSNPWTAEYLPNASPRPMPRRGLGPVTRGGQWVLERILSSRPMDAIERWERERRMARLRCEAAQQGGTDVILGPDLCKGHIGDRSVLVRQRYTAHLESQGIVAGGLARMREGRRTNG